MRLIVKLAFDIFDVDRQGVLDLYECDALLRMVYDVEVSSKQTKETKKIDHQRNTRQDKLRGLTC